MRRSAAWVLLFTPCHSLCFEAFDCVLTASACVALDEACTAASSSVASHRLVDRRRLEAVGSPLGTVQGCLERVLAELGDASPFVEWWWRDEWRHLDMHRDLDEVLARDTNNERSSALPGGAHRAAEADPDLRCPTHGHVLYLDVGADVAGGPTVLWGTQASAAASDCTSLDVESMAVVPAVRGRLLRFAGATLHSVPRPPLAYLDLEDGGTGGVIHTRSMRIAGDDESTRRRRSVVLFNTWQTPPAGFDEVAAPVLALAAASAPARNRSDGGATVSTRADWLEVAVRDLTAGAGAADAAATVRIKVGLLGDRRRRGSAERHWVGWAEGAAAADALRSTSAAVVVPVAKARG
jgi:hypothetical protein